MATPIPSNEASFSIRELVTITSGSLTRGGKPESSVVGFTTDSRAVVPRNAFVAIRGEKLDGHAFLDTAAEHGASLVVVERGRAVPAHVSAVLEVDSPLVAFGAVARAHVERWRRSHVAARVVAVTGSAGKTTTKELLAAVLGAVGPCLFTKGNLNNRVGLPAVALGFQDQRYGVFELGMSIPGEIAALAQIVRPDVAVLLNVGLAHAEGFGGSREKIAREKGAIFEALPGEGVAVVNADDALAYAQRLRTPARCVRFGVSEATDVRLIHREPTPDGRSRVTIERADGRFDILLPLPGKAAATDLAAAIAAADAAVGERIPPEIIAAAVEAWIPAGGRSVSYTLENGVVVLDDSYNANPASMRAAFATLAELKSTTRGRAICVLGEMRELGPISQREHAALGQELAHHRFDLVVGCGGEINLAVESAAAAGLVVRSCAGPEEAGLWLVNEVRRGDVVLFKGSRGAEVERALAILLARHPRGSAPDASATRGVT